MKSLHFLYHELYSEPSSYSYALQCSQFERHCELFARLRGNPGQTLIPEVTFDDGHRSNCEFALPLLKRYGLGAHFFVTVGWIGCRAQYMNWDELRALHAAGQHIGAHGWSHALLTHCSASQLEQELSGARRKLEDELGSPVTTMSLPGGRINQKVLDACWAAGYVEVFTSSPRSEATCRDVRCTVGRLNIRSSFTLAFMEEVLRLDNRLLSKLQRKEQLRTIAKNLLGDSLYARIWSIVNRQEDEVGPSGALIE